MFTDLKFEEGVPRVLKVQIGDYRYPVTFTKKGDRLWAAYAFNKKITEELKALEGTTWHGFKDQPIKAWSLSDSQHNRFQLDYLAGGNPYEWYDKNLETNYIWRPELRQHQIDIAQFELTRHYCVVAAEMGTGKTLSTISCMEQSGAKSWLWIAPKSAMYSVQLEFDKWKSQIRPQFYTYEGLRELAKNWPKDSPPPQGLVLDEASRCKTHTAQRTQAAKWMADYIREYWGDKGYVILMSGSPAPKSPVDWWSLCNIACPGFLKEGNPEKFRFRLAIMKQAEGVAGTYSALESWLDDEKKCKVCGKYADDYIHDVFNLEQDHHVYLPSKNEVAYLYQRMNGLVLVKLKKDCLDLPEKQYRVILVKPSQNIINAAKLLVAQGNSGIKTLTLLRELSDGFQYDEQAIGTETCPLCKGERTAIDFIYTGPDDQYDEMMRRQYEGLEIPEGVFQEGSKACPHCDGTGEVTSYTRVATQVESAKEQVLSDLFDEHEDIGRLVVYAGFTGSVDRCVEIAKKNHWNWIRVDGRGWASSLEGLDAKELLLKFQGKDERRLVFIGQPSAAGMGLTLTASPTIVYYSNDFNAESRVQSEDRIHRMGMDINRGATIIDLIHLPSDELVLNNLKKKKKLQAMTMGELNNELNSYELQSLAR
jgi:hypothetical protein